MAAARRGGNKREAEKDRGRKREGGRRVMSFELRAKEPAIFSSRQPSSSLVEGVGKLQGRNEIAQHVTESTLRVLGSLVGRFCSAT